MRAAVLAVALTLFTGPLQHQLDRPSGLDAFILDPSVRPQDDLYLHVNGPWLAGTGIPDDRVAFGAFNELTDKTDADLRAIIEAAASGHPRTGSIEQQIGDLYASVLDERRVEELGASPMREVLARIDAVRSPHDLADAAGYLSFLGAGGPFGTNVVVDATDASRLIVQVSQGGTLLPAREYYLGNEAAFATAREQYVAYLATVFRLSGRQDPAADARGVLEIETALARIQLSPNESRAAARALSSLTLRELTTQLPAFDWKAWAKPQGIDRAAAVALMQPRFFADLDALIPKIPLECWKDWLAARYITATAPYLSKAFVDARFEFFGRVLTGQTEPRARWKVGVSLVSSFLGDALGRLYVARHLSPRARERAEGLVANIIKANRQAIKEAEWLTPSARDEAQAKLSRVTARVGSPQRWRDYTGLVIKREDLAGNVQRGRRFDADYRLTRTTGRPGQGEWLVTPQTVNAYYNPGLNEMVLPAALLQPPLFDAGADDAVNYGALGATVGHELTHALDERGRRYDAAGMVRQWWSAADEQEFRRRSAMLVTQFSAYRPAPDRPLDGELTLAENLGDLVGLSVALRAYRMSVAGRSSPPGTAMDGERRFFLSWARMWRMKVRGDYLRQWLQTLPYAPYEYRANVAVSNMNAFYDAFGVTASDRLFRPPGARVTFW